MAGIGFELRRMIDERGGFLSKVRAYAAAGLISSGPWLMTILTLTLLNLLAPRFGVNAGIEMFRALVTYAFAFSLVLVGTGQMAVTRRVADLLYAHRYNRVLPAFTASMLVTGGLAFAIASIFCAVAGFEPALSLVAVSLFMIVSMTWLALTWLSVAREYDMVLRAYVYGTLVSVGGIVFCAITSDTVAVLAAYTAGQAFTLMVLTRTIVRGMEADGKRDFTVFRALLTFPRLVGVGLFYNLAIWVDKMIFWFRDGVGPHEMVQFHPLYDTCCFLAYLTVVPALAVNLVRLETSFYEKYREYYGAILAGTPLAYIEDKRTRMFETLQESTIRLLRVQGAITVLLIIFAPYFIDWLELPLAAIRIFRLACLGAFFHVMLLITILMQMYFDLRKQAMGTSLFFLLLNGGMAWWSVSTGPSTYGVGYAAASFVSLLLGYSLLHRSLEKLDYLTFTGQPIDDGTSPLDMAEELEDARKRSADAANAEFEPDEEELKEEGVGEEDGVPAPTDTELDPTTESAPTARRQAIDPVTYPVALREVERIAERQLSRESSPIVELLPDPFQPVELDSNFAQLDDFWNLEHDLEEELDQLAEEPLELPLEPEPQSLAPSSLSSPERVTPLRSHDATADFSNGGGGTPPTATEIGSSPTGEPVIEHTDDKIILYPSPPPPPEHVTPSHPGGAANGLSETSPTATELGSLSDGANAEPDKVALYPPMWRDEDNTETATSDLEELADTDPNPPREVGGPIEDPDTGTQME